MAFTFREDSMSEYTEDEIERMERNLSNAMSKFRSGLGGKAAMGYEKEYGIAYQQLVRAGKRPQLKKKYRI